MSEAAYVDGIVIKRMNRFGVKSMENKTEQPWHQLPVEEVVQFLGANLSTGLSAEEVRKRQKEHGPNRVTARRGLSFFSNSTSRWFTFSCCRSSLASC